MKMQTTETLKDEKMTNLILQTPGASNGVIVDNKTTFEEWFIDDECSSENIKVLDKSKEFLH